MNTDHPITMLQWDSEFFGFPVGRFDLDDVLSEQPACLDGLRFKLLYVYSKCWPSTSVAWNSFLEERLVNERVEFGFALSPDDTAVHPLGIEALSNNPTERDICAVKALAIASGFSSRFHVDPRFPNELFERLYLAWAENSISGQIADVVAVCRDSNAEINGMLTLSVDNGTANIGLVAVAKAHRGQSIASRLLNYAQSVAGEMGAHTLKVATQAGNIAACRTYLKNGFTERRRRFMFHVWDDTR